MSSLGVSPLPAASNPEQEHGLRTICADPGAGVNVLAETIPHGILLWVIFDQLMPIDTTLCQRTLDRLHMVPGSAF